MDKKIVGLLGLGNMGLAMAETLLRTGYQVFGYDISPAQQQRAEALGVVHTASIAELCQRADTQLLSLPAAAQVKQVLTGPDGMFAHAQANTLIIDTSTSEPEVTKVLTAQAYNLGLALLDCPVSGGPAGAAAGTMVMLVGGKEEHLLRAKPLLQALTSKIVHLGPAGSGHAAKLINNLLCAANIVLTAEAVKLGEQVGLPAAKLIAGINAGSGRSGVSEVNYPRWILNNNFNSGFTMRLMRKDVGLAKQLMVDNQLELPVCQQVAELWHASTATIADSADFNAMVNFTAANGKEQLASNDAEVCK